MASISNTLLHPQLPKLNGKNYYHWSIQMKVLFESQELWDIVDQGFDEPEEIDELTQDELRELRKKDKKALYTIYQAVDEIIFERISSTISSKDAWDTLYRTYRGEDKGKYKNLTENHHHDFGLMGEQIYVPPPPPLPPLAMASQLQQLNLPRQDLLNDGRRRYFVDICVPLCKASIKGNWKVAEPIFRSNRNLVQYSITENCEAALHVAASAESTDFMVELLKRMNKEDLLLQTITGDTALCLAAAAGNVKMASILVNKNEDLLTISGSEGLLPLSVAALYGNHGMVIYLYEKSKNMKGPEWKYSSKQWLLTKCVHVNLFDIALKIIEEHGELGQSENILRLLAKKPSAFNESKSLTSANEAMKLLKTIWATIVERPKAEVDKILRGTGSLINGMLTYPSPILFVATKMGNTGFVVELINEYPGLIWKKNDNNQSIFHIAVSHRQKSIYSLLYEIGSMKDLITRLRDPEQNNMLHLVGKNEDKSQSKEENQSKNFAGAAFQMQRELLWFKEVESMVPPHFSEEKNRDGLTPHELFKETHKGLVFNAEKWMKETASQCMLVATLIATVVFAIVFAFPGGYNQNTGFPIFLRKGTFIVFVVFDAISLISSSTSILLFLSIFTSNYDQQDFLKSLPQKLLIGIVMLFLSIVTMMIAFSLSFFVLFQEKFIGLAISIGVLALIPTISFIILHHRFLKNAFRSQSSTKIVFKPKKQLLFYQNPTS